MRGRRRTDLGSNLQDRWRYRQPLKSPATLSVRLYGDPVLRQPATRVSPPDEKLSELARCLEATMRVADGIGLAAPQVGISLQIALVDLRKVEKRPSSLEMAGKAVDWRTQMPLFFCNPIITLTRKREEAEEGCLSFPNVYGAVRRSLRIRMDYQDLQGRPMSLQAGGLLARALQHEVDHLQGILFIDRMEPEIRKSIAPSLLELMQTTQSKAKAG